MPWSPQLNAPAPGSELFAITQPGYELAANVTLDDDRISSDIPAVPTVRREGDGWWLLYSRQPRR